MNTQLISTTVLSAAMVLSAFILGGDIKKAAEKIQIQSDPQGYNIHLESVGPSFPITVQPGNPIPVSLTPNGTFYIQDNK